MATYGAVARRLRELEERLERATPEPKRQWVVWFTAGDGTVCQSGTGEVLSREDFDRFHPGAYRIQFDITHPRDWELDR